MSTSARVAIGNADGTFSSIQVNFDGYVKGGVGEALATHYPLREDAEAIVGLGAVRAIAGTKDWAEIEAYADRGEMLIISNDPSMARLTWRAQEYCEQYVYLFTLEGRWVALTPDSEHFVQLDHLVF